MIRVLICDDQLIVCEGLRAILSTADDIEVIGVVNNGQEAQDYLASNQPDIVLMDLKMPVMNGVEATQHIKDTYHDVFVLVLTTYDADNWVVEALRAGASGYLLKDTPREDLMAAIKGTVAGKTHIDPSVAGKLVQQMAEGAPRPLPSTTEDLTERELDVLRLMAQGMTNSDIAKALHLSEGTVRNYVSAILDKLNVEDRTQAAVFALKYGLARLNDDQTES